FNNEYLQDPSLQTITAIKTQNLKYPREGYTYNASQDVVYGVRELAYCAYGKEFMQDYDNHISVAPE
ncbi:MAG: ABC transporter substrate-binding protein, partial [Negativicutes bacterium]|nr:ABC transporter substrate-binding protein [Negativicutes bacterium]